MTDKPTRIVLETNQGGMTFILCGCGCLVFEGMDDEHATACVVLRSHRNSTETEGT